MSDLVYQNYNNKCQGWVNPANLMFGPEISSLSSYQSPAGSTTVVVINGSNFYSYSTILFGTFTPTVYFVNSNILQFYIPNTIFTGIYPIQVFNGSIGSNIVNYTIDNASGYWMLNAAGNTNTIYNTNSNGVSISWLTRNGLMYISNTGTPPPFGSPATAFPITNTMNWISCNGGGGLGGDTYLSLPVGQIYIGRELMIKSVSDNVISSISNIIPLSGIGTQSLITTALHWVTLINKDGTNWEIVQQGS